MASNRKRNPRLGRGLSSLMAQPVSTDPEQAPAAPPTDAGGDGSQPAADSQSSPVPAEAETAPAAPQQAGVDDERAAGAADGLRHLPVATIRPNPHQPRQTLDEGALRPLADSIKADGLMQPIVVRPADGEAHDDAAFGIEYELVAGERRWRAAQIAGLETVPALVRSLDEQQVAEWALIENLQREDLNPIERAEAFQHLAETFGLSHDQIGRRVGLDRSSVANLLRLLNLSDVVRSYLRQELLSMGQARAIAGLSDAERQQVVADRAIRQGLSVRQVEQTVRELTRGSGQGAGGSGAGGGGGRSAYLVDLERQIGEQLQTKVHLRTGRKKGTGSLTIDFYSLEQFDALLQKLGVSTE
jgi:ParB family chromosome partitioning protein